MHTTKIPRLHLNLQTDNTEFVNNPRRVYFLVRSGSGADHVVHAVEEDRVHADGHFPQDAPRACNGEADRRKRHGTGPLRLPLCPVRSRCRH